MNGLYKVQVHRIHPTMDKEWTTFSDILTREKALERASYLTKTGRRVRIRPVITWSTPE